MYVTAAQKPIENRGHGSDRVYALRGLDWRTAAARRALGVPATVAQSLQGSVAEPHLPWLTTTFSVVGLRALATRRLSAHDLLTLRELAQDDDMRSRLRGYVSKTSLQVSEIDWLMNHGVSFRAAAAWQTRLPQSVRRVNLYTVLSTATVLYGLPEDQVSGWVRYTNRFNVSYAHERGGWRFLGGDTALFVSAGVSPAEASRMTARNEVDRAGLGLLAALRTPVGQRVR